MTNRLDRCCRSKQDHCAHPLGMEHSKVDRVESTKRLVTGRWWPLGGQDQSGGAGATSAVPVATSRTRAGAGSSESRPPTIARRQATRRHDHTSAHDTRSKRLPAILADAAAAGAAVKSVEVAEPGAYQVAEFPIGSPAASSGSPAAISMVAGLLERDGGEVVVAGEPMTTRAVRAKSAIGRALWRQTGR
jgi:hypothetical protein